MFARIYAGLWAAFLLLVLLLFVTGNLTNTVSVSLGFVCFGLIFMGMMCVLPTTVTHHHHGEEPELAPEPNRSEAKPARREGGIKAWVFPDGPEVRRPHFH